MLLIGSKSGVCLVVSDLDPDSAGTSNTSSNHSQIRPSTWLTIRLLISSKVKTVCFSLGFKLSVNIGDLEGSKPGPLNINPDQLTLDAWNYIFLKTEYKDCPVSKEKLDVLREQFRYFHPWDLRCSAKDLIRNHLTMSLYNHAVSLNPFWSFN